MKKKMFIALTALTGILILSAFMGNQCAVSQTQKVAPDFSLSTIDGETLKLSDYKGKVIILDFWATWCPPCRKEIPDLIKLYDKYKDKGLIIIGISSEDTNTLKEFSEDNGINYPIALGNQKVAEAYGGIQYIPTTFVIDREGNIIKKHVGFTEYEVFEAEIKELLQ